MPALNLSPALLAAIAAAVVGLAVAAFFGGRVVWHQLLRWAWKLGTLRRWLAAKLARWSRVLPYSHSVQKAVLYTVVVMIVSLVAPQLSQWIGEVLSLLLKDECVVLRNCLTISVIAGSSTAITFVFLGEKPASFASRVLERLSGSAKPDGGEPLERVEFVTRAHIRPSSEHEREYLNIESARMGVPELMIVLRQSERRKYTIEVLEEQLKLLRTKIKAENDRRERRAGCFLPDSKKLIVKWVCFVSAADVFHAFQPYATFCFHILIKHNSRYVSLLNTTTEKELADAVENENNLSQRFKIRDSMNAEREAFIPDAIPDLDPTWIRKGLTYDKVLDIFIRKGKTRAMLVTGLGHFHPLGVLTATELAKLVLYEPLTKYELYQPLSNEEGHLYGDDSVERDALAACFRQP